MSTQLEPKVLSDLEIAFATDVSGLLPRYEDVPEEFKQWPPRNEYVRFIEGWFYRGADTSTLKPRDGIDKQTAIRHISACMHSFEPKHEHKIAGCAYLLSQWFTL